MGKPVQRTVYRGVYDERRDAVEAILALQDLLVRRGVPMAALNEFLLAKRSAFGDLSLVAMVARERWAEIRVELEREFPSPEPDPMAEIPF